MSLHDNRACIVIKCLEKAMALYELDNFACRGTQSLRKLTCAPGLPADAWHEVTQ